jgi:putrescine transport system ATP-binding protein
MTETPRPVFAPWDNPDEKPLIQFQNVSKRFGEFTAIQNLTVDIFEREFFALLGPSGCGKTTLMRMLAGFEAPTEGRILLGDYNIAQVPPNKRAVNMMFQSYALFPHLSVWDNIAFGLRREGIKGDALTSRVEEMLRLTRLERFKDRKPHQISGGQRQRVALARSLAKAPKLLLLDEPLGALDKKLRQDTQFELMDIQERTETTFVIVTHDQEEAMTVASRIAVMDEGSIIQVDTPAQIYEAPKNVYVADFIGDVNILEGRAKQHGDQIYIKWGEGVSDIIAMSNEPFKNEDLVHFAIRPEKVSVTSERPVGSPNAFQGKVLDIAYLGNMSTYHIKMETGLIIKAQSTNTHRLSNRPITWDDNVWISFTSTAGVLLKE